MRVWGRALVILGGGLALGALGMVLLSPRLRSRVLSLIRGGGAGDLDAEDDAGPNIVLRAPDGQPAPLSQAVAEGIAAAGGAPAASAEF